MIRTLLVLALAGWVLAAGPPFRPPGGQEQWKFVGKIMAGMSNPRQTFAGSVLDIDIAIQRNQDKSIDVTFSQVTSQEFNKQIYIGQPTEEQEGDSRHGSKDFVGEMRPVPELEGSFKAYLDRDQGTVMEVPQDDQQWVTNIRKAIINMIRVPPYVGDQHFVDLERNAFSKEHSPMAAEERISFKKREHIFAGICNVSYTMSNDYNDGRFPGSPDDVIPGGNSDYYRMHRSVDYDSCLDVVNFQKSSIGNFSRSYKSQMKEVTERSTYGEYIMKKNSDGSFQLKGIRQTGDTIMRPFGQDTGRAVVHSNQTMALLSLGRSSPSMVQAAPPSGSQKPVTTWLYQFTSPAAADPATKVDWVIYENKPLDQALYPEYAVTGDFYFQQQDIFGHAQAALDTITKLQQAQVTDNNTPYNGTTDGRLTNLIKVLARSIRALDKENVKKLFDATENNVTPSDKIMRQSFLDAVAASGSSHGIMELIDAAKAGKVPVIRMGGIMPLLTNSIMDPHAVNKLMDYVMTLDETSLYLDMMAHLNFAKLAERVCLDEQLRNYSVPQAYLGNRRCDRTAIETTFVDHLKKKIDESTQTWRKLMFTQTLATLGLESTIPYLCQLAVGQNQSSSSPSSPSIRMGAIYSLSNHFQRGEKREKVLRELLPIAESHCEDFEVREIAFIAIMYMRPNATILQRFAFHTWRDPSVQMRSLVTSTFISLAHSDDPDFHSMSSMARKMLPMLRYTQPSLQNIILADYKTRIPDYKVGVSAKLAWLSTQNSRLKAPRQVLADFEADFGGIVTPVFKVYAMLDLDLPRSMQSSRNSRDAQQKKIHNELAELSADLEFEQKQGNNEVFMFASSFNYQGFMAVTEQGMTAAKQKVKSFLEAAVGKASDIAFPDQMVKFFNLVDIFSMLPTPFGTPSIVDISAPNNWLSNYQEVVTKEGNENFNITLDGLSKMVMKTQSFVKVMMPWHNKTAVAGIDTEHSINTPGKVSILIGKDFPYPIFKATISPAFKGEIPMLYSRSKPLSALQDISPSGDLAGASSIISPSSASEAQYQRNFNIPAALYGQKARVTYQGDVEYPYEQSHMMEFVQHPERLMILLTAQTQKEYALAYRLNIDESEAKNITFAAMINLKRESLPSHMPLNGTLEQIGQRMAEKMSITSSMEEKLAMARAGEFGDFIVAFAVNFTTPNVGNRQYEVAFCGSNQTQSNPSEYKQNMVLNIMSMGPPEKPQERKICFVTSITEKLKPSDSDAERSQLYTTAETNLYAGQDCSSDSKVGQVDVRMYLSDDDRNNPQHSRSLSEGLFLGTEGRTPWITDAIYDRMDMQFRWFSKMPAFCQNMTNRIQDLAYGHMFPHVVRNRVVSNKGDDKLIVVNVTRSMASATVDAWVHSSDEIVYIEQVDVVPLFDWASPLLGPHQPYHHHTSNQPGRRSLQAAGGVTCMVGAEQVATFDGVSFKKMASNCWTVAAQVHHQEDSFAIMTRQAESSPQGELEVQILLPDIAKIELLKGHQVKMNGQAMSGSQALKDTSGKVIGSMNMTSSSIMVSVPSKMEVILQGKSNLTIKLLEKYRSFMNGMCGDFNGEQAADMRSPKGCIYTPEKGPVFAASWVAKKSSCSDQSMQAALHEAMQGEAGSCHKSVSSNSKPDHQSSSRQSRRQ